MLPLVAFFFFFGKIRTSFVTVEGLFPPPQAQKNNLFMLFFCAWQRPTLTETRVPTTIGAEKLNFRVRYGTGVTFSPLLLDLFF
jgi:hypothetical protein